MSATRITYHRKVFLDLTDTNNYDAIYSKLKIARIRSSYYVKSGIKIGKYVIFVSPSNSDKFKRSSVSIRYLSLNDNLKVNIQEKSGNHFKNVKSNLFEDEDWVFKYLKSSFSLQDLANMIMFCKRLENLNSFS